VLPGSSLARQAGCAARASAARLRKASAQRAIKEGGFSRIVDDQLGVVDTD
jgi:hypothetical protein